MMRNDDDDEYFPNHPQARYGSIVVLGGSTEEGFFDQSGLLFGHPIFLYAFIHFSSKSVVLSSLLGLVALFNGISTFVGYLMPKLFS